MKLKFILVVALAVFVIAPAVASPTVTGTMRMGVFGDVIDNHYVGRLDRARLIFSSNIDEYNTLRLELRADRNREELGTNNVYGGAIPMLTPGRTFADSGAHDMKYAMALHAATVRTNWARFFGFEDTVGLATTVGMNAFTTFSRVGGYTIWATGSQELGITRNLGGRLDLTIADGLVRPYIAGSAYAFRDNDSHVFGFLGGVGFDFNAIDVPLWLEAFFIQDGDEDHRAFGVEAQFAMEVADDMNLRIGGVLDMRNAANWGGNHWGNGVFNPDNDWLAAFKALADFSAMGATFGVAFLGIPNVGPDDDMGLGKLAVSFAYNFTNFFTLQAGAKFAFGNYSEFLANDEVFLGAEFGVRLRPGRVTYAFGYVFLNEDANGAYASDTWGLGGVASNDLGQIIGRSRAAALNTGAIFFGVNASF
ncbi:MAG: hypothetical protein FWC36_10560 [Spirochaetes bacterium]|nr:hypothetical protein [Spirochaetota bacterium]